MSSTDYGERRREPRTPTSGEILIEVKPGGKVIRAQLSDASPHGFAIVHEYEKFVPGQQVTVVYDWEADINKLRIQ